jgi:Fe-S oxidoreductase
MWLIPALLLAVALVLSVALREGRIFFFALGAVSIWDFLRTLQRRGIFSALRQAELPGGNLAGRLWRVLSEVVLQTRVIRERPLVGLAHAIVLWGFLVFAWVSARHLWLGVRGLEHAGAEHHWYDAFAAVWAAAVLVAIGGLSYRRFVLRPAALGPLSGTSAIVAALIAVLMVTHILAWGVLPAGTAAWKANWWAHTAAFFGMLVVIPKSKHLHLLLGPVAIFFRSDRVSALRPLRNEEDFGMIRFQDLAWKDVLDIHACVECGRCTDVCPAHRSGGTLDPKQIILRMQHGMLAGGDIVAGTVDGRPAWVSEKDLFQCLSCGACEYACPVGIEHVGRKILDLRRGLVSEGRVENEKLVELFNVMERAPHNPWGIGRSAREKFIQRENFPLFDGSQEWLFWLGCGLNYDAQGQKVAVAMSRILNAAGVSWGVLAEETCCGEPARRSGNEYLYLQLSETLIEQFRQRKVKQILSCCPHCTTMLDVDYRQIPAYQELGIRVRHHSEMIAELLPKLPLERAPRPVTYHDPCYLARVRGVTEAPRAVLSAAGLELKEMQHSRTSTSCCGAGGGQIFIAEDIKESERQRVNHMRFAEVISTGAPAVAVACPNCRIMLQDAAIHAGRDSMPVEDIAEVIARQLKPEASTAAAST